VAAVHRCSLLRLREDMLGWLRLGQAACAGCCVPMRACWSRPGRARLVSSVAPVVIVDVVAV
jgi:hypothetical protein